jgi:hypothetical protein
MRALDAIASRYGQRPSAILGISDAWAAYQFDLAVLNAGRTGESGNAEGTAGGKPYSGLGRKARKMAVPESGVW